MDIASIFMLIGGLAFFLFGMHIMSNSLEKLAGGQLQSILQKLTSSSVKSLALGAVITIVIQSSSALTVMLVGLVNSNIMEIGQTIHVIMGSDIGTTLTAWILSLSGIQSDNLFISLLKPESFAPLLALIGVVMIMASKSQRRRDIGTILCGFAVLMYGMTLMSDSVEPLAESPEFQNLLIAFSNPIVSLLIGTAFTGVIQSSAASIGVLQALSLTGQISFGMAAPIVMGANIGTCVTALLSAFGVSRKAKRVPAIHIGIKILGTLIWMTVYMALRYLFRLSFFEGTASAFQIALFHTLFNIGTIVVLLPFSGQIVRMAEKILPLRDEGNEGEEAAVLLDSRLLLSPGLAVQQCREKTVEMADLAAASFRMAWDLFDDFHEDRAEEIGAMEERLDFLEDELDSFLIQLSRKELTDGDSNAVSEMLHGINDFERIGDHAINLTKTAREMSARGRRFSRQARHELAVLRAALDEILELTLASFRADDPDGARQVEPLEEVIDDLTMEMKNRHIDRLRTGECSAELGIVLNDVLTNCERISDHCSNVAVSIIQTRNSTLDAHGYLNELKRGRETGFAEDFGAFRDKYLLPAVREPKKKDRRQDLSGKGSDKAKKGLKSLKKADLKEDKREEKKEKKKVGRQA